MKRIEHIVQAEEFPEDVARLRAGIECLRELPGGYIELLYSDWSEREYSAGWITMHDSTIARFGAWLTEEVG